MDIPKKLERKHREIWRVVFTPEYDGQPATFEFCKGSGDSGYWKQEDKISLELSELDLEGSLDAQGRLIERKWLGPSAWYSEMLHEICHEVENKLQDCWEEGTGKQLMESYGAGFEKESHGVHFFAAIGFVAKKLNVLKENLIKEI